MKYAVCVYLSIYIEHIVQTMNRNWTGSLEVAKLDPILDMY
jgi:hypothetical protein